MTNKRTAERLIRAAYEYEALAQRMIADGFESEGNGVAHIASRLGDIGRSLMDVLEGR